MNKRDRDYIDSVVDIAAQELRHFYNFTDEQVIKLMRDSLDRAEAKNNKVRQAFDNLTGREEWQPFLDQLTIRK